MAYQLDGRGGGHLPKSARPRCRRCRAILQALDSKFSPHIPHLSPHAVNYRRQWLQLLSDARQQLDNPPLTFSEEGAVRLLEQQLSSLISPHTSHLSPHSSHLIPLSVHYANSTAIRLANRYAKGHPVWCNRGTNGIEGSLSTAAGFAAAVLSPHPPIPHLLFSASSATSVSSTTRMRCGTRSFHV